MKSTLIPVCVSIIALITVQPAFAKEKAKAHKEAKASGRAVHVKSAPVKRSTVVKPSPPKHPWVGHTVAISPSERDVIRAYVHHRVEASKGGKFNGVPQGLAKKVTWG